jgi:hypothetical protein
MRYVDMVRGDAKFLTMQKFALDKISRTLPRNVYAPLTISPHCITMEREIL